MAAAFLTALALVGVVGQTSSVAAKGQLRKLREGAGSFRSLHDGGTYNPKSAWMMVNYFQCLNHILGLIFCLVTKSSHPLSK